MKRSKIAWVVLAVLIISLLCLSSCKKTEQEEMPQQVNSEGTALNGNQSNGGQCAKVGDYLIACGNSETNPIFYSIDTINDTCAPNCSDPTCQHISYKCPAFISDNQESPIVPIQDGFLMADANTIYRFGLESKEVVATGNYGKLGLTDGINNNLVGDFVTYFTEDKTLEVKNYKTDEVVATFEDCEPSRYGMGNVLYYNDYLYFCRNDAQLVRTNLQDGNLEVVVPSKAYHIMIYEDQLYYTNTTSKQVFRAELDGNNSQKIVDRAIAYNIKDGRIYYAPEAGPEIFSCDLNGRDIVQLTQYGDFPDGVGGIYLFDDCNYLAFTTYNYSKLYTVDLNGEGWKVYTFEQ
ncbi:TolB family protein [Solibaculum mannosilyticum]|uniref:TolB family protein n=1 Tax=Solibaculum mannosilyticum TaxID=2780922 RepID=UPI0007A8CE7E|nr:hypothetical protein BN3661_00225 [Eubacteriaceae bacterium CHKCI005]